jgi:acetyl-CoA C-acetyltransferase
MTEPVIVAGTRTPIGRIMGGFSDLTAQDLGGVAVAGALERCAVAGGPCM